jgi:hypothetical protein
MEITKRWPMTSLLDVLKETDLRVDFTRFFRSRHWFRLMWNPSMLQI